MNIKNENIELTKKILSDRVNYYRKIKNYEKAIAYESALSILEYMLDNNYECLSQFDYFKEEE